MNIALTVGLVPRDFAAVAAHTDRVGHEFIAVSDELLNERLIRNIFFIGQDLELIEHSRGNRSKIDFTGASMPRSNSISTRLDLEKLK